LHLPSLAFLICSIILQAILTLLCSTDIQEKQNANRWLVEFVSTPEAWNIAQELILSQVCFLSLLFLLILLEIHSRRR
jgi:hypothetical protein